MPQTVPVTTRRPLALARRPEGLSRPSAAAKNPRRALSENRQDRFLVCFISRLFSRLSPRVPACLHIRVVPQELRPGFQVPSQVTKLLHLQVGGGLQPAPGRMVGLVARADSDIWAGSSS